MGLTMAALLSVVQMATVSPTRRMMKSTLTYTILHVWDLIVGVVLPFEEAGWRALEIYFDNFLQEQVRREQSKL
jgi:hypothetical protein